MLGVLGIPSLKELDPQQLNPLIRMALQGMLGMQGVFWLSREKMRSASHIGADQLTGSAISCVGLPKHPLHPQHPLQNPVFISCYSGLRVLGVA